MKQLSLFNDERDLFDKLCDLKYLKDGFKAVKRNGGSPGIDGVTIKEYGLRLHEEPCTDPYARFCGQTGAFSPF